MIIDYTLVQIILNEEVEKLVLTGLSPTTGYRHTFQNEFSVTFFNGILSEEVDLALFLFPSLRKKI